jgi:DNA invertase Pin-like site-specific DNA recombinase
VASGAKTDRPQLRRLVSELAASDVVMVTRLNHPERSTRDLLNTLTAIVGKRVRPARSCDKMGRNTTPHCHLMLTLLGGLAEFEGGLRRDRTRERTRAGSELAQPTQTGPSPRVRFGSS